MRIVLKNDRGYELKLNIRFQYSRLRDAHTGLTFILPVTQCIAEEVIRDEPGNRAASLIAKGGACCHFLDQFDKRIGRKIAFERMLKVLQDHLSPGFANHYGSPKKLRSYLWTEFKKHFKLPGRTKVINESDNQ